jgi:lipid A oxidase
MKSLAVAALLSVSTSAVFAQGLTDGLELSFYTGYQDAPHSTVSGSDPGGLGDFSFFADWEGKSFSPPPYYGFRATWWKTDNWGWGVELNHAKIYATDETLADNGIDHLEFSDGLNIITANYARRWPEAFGRFTPYVIGGLGIAVPHVELTTAGGRTFEYQLTGPALEAVAGLTYKFNDRWSAFGEYKFTYSQNKAELDNGGSLETDVITNAVNLGVSFSF